MVTSVVRTFGEPDEFASAIRPAYSQCTITGRGVYSAALTTVNLERVFLRQFETGMAQTSYAALSADHVVFAFLLSDTENTSVAGLDMQPNAIIQCGLGHEYFTRSLGPRSIGHILLSHAAMDDVVRNAGTQFTDWQNTHALTPAAHTRARLVQLQRDAARLARDAPEVLARPAAAHGLEQALIEAMSDCLADIQPLTVTTSQRYREAVVRRFQRLFEEDSSASLFIPEICAKIGVGETDFPAVLPGAAWREPKALSYVAQTARCSAETSERGT
jgi:hypothetical protein